MRLKQIIQALTTGGHRTEIVTQSCPQSACLSVCLMAGLFCHKITKHRLP